jgi:hypothetical protein
MVTHRICLILGDSRRWCSDAVRPEERAELIDGRPAGDEEREEGPEGFGAERHEVCIEMHWTHGASSGLVTTKYNTIQMN